MRTPRTCDSAQLYTGTSKCPPNFGKMRAVILVPPGTKLPADLTAEKLEKLIHAEHSSRAYGIAGLCEYAKNGGEVQTAATGWGPEQVTGVSARKDAFDLEKYYPELDASLMQTANSQWDAYFIDEDNFLHGIDDGTDTLAGYPMSSVYGESSPIATSSARPTMQIVLCHKDAKLSKVRFNYIKLGFELNTNKMVLGLVAVSLVKAGEAGNKYRLLEVKGGFDVTSIYGPLIAEAGTGVINGSATAVTYDEADDTLVIASDEGVVPSLKPANVLYENGIKGIEQSV